MNERGKDTDGRPVPAHPAGGKTGANRGAGRRNTGAGTGPDAKPKELGGPKGPEPTRYGDWEVGGRCTDF